MESKVERCSQEFIERKNKQRCRDQVTAGGEFKETEEKLIFEEN